MPKNHDSYPIQQSSHLKEATTWYRNLGPNKPIDEVPMDKHADAMTSSILEVLGQEVPDSTYDKYQSLMMLATDESLQNMGSILATEGSAALVIADMMLEFTERKKPTVSNNERAKFLFISASLLEGLRENPNTELRDRLSANAQLSNAKIALLNIERARNKVPGTDYSSKYIAIVRNEARWFSENTQYTEPAKDGKPSRIIGASAGDLFENYITCLSRQFAWQSEQEFEILVRHATIREDKPNPIRDGGSGHEFAHDIHVSGEGGTKLVQCKWGAGANEHRLYDPSLIMIIETSDDGYLSNNERFKAAFQALAESNKLKNQDSIDEACARYNIEAIVKPSRADIIAKAQTSITELAIR